MTTDEPGSGFDGLSDVDRTIHEPARLRLMAHLSVLERADFLFLLRRTGLTRGNLSTHLRKLEEASFVDVEKAFVERIPRTTYRITDEGRAALVRYREQMLAALEGLGRQELATSSEPERAHDSAGG